MTRGAADLVQLQVIMEEDRAAWLPDEFKQVENVLARGRVLIQQHFARWLSMQLTKSPTRLSAWQHRMGLVQRNLTQLGLKEDETALAKRTQRVSRNVEILQKIAQLSETARNLDVHYPVHSSTRITEIAQGLQAAKRCEILAQAAAQKGLAVGKEQLTDVRARIDAYEERCEQQLARHQRDLQSVYQAEPVGSAAVTELRLQAERLAVVYAGTREEDDLLGILRQLERLESDYRRLGSTELTPRDYKAQLELARTENAKRFGQDEPPLDNDALYDCMKRALDARRDEAAARWMDANLPAKSAVARLGAGETIRLERQLSLTPGCLDDKQQRKVQKAIVRCQRRRVELQVAGLVAQYDAMDAPSQASFLKRIGARLQ